MEAGHQAAKIYSTITGRKLRFLARGKIIDLDILI